MELDADDDYYDEFSNSMFLDEQQVLDEAIHGSNDDGIDFAGSSGAGATNRKRSLELFSDNENRSKRKSNGIENVSLVDDGESPNGDVTQQTKTSSSHSIQMTKTEIGKDLKLKFKLINDKFYTINFIFSR